MCQVSRHHPRRRSVAPRRSGPLPELLVKTCATHARLTPWRRRPLNGVEAGAWFTEQPASPIFDWDADSVRTAPRQRFRIPFLAQDTHRDDAPVCPCAGDRNRRHHALVPVFCEAAQEAGHTQQEKRHASSPPKLWAPKACWPRPPRRVAWDFTVTRASTLGRPATRLPAAFGPTVFSSRIKPSGAAAAFGLRPSVTHASSVFGPSLTSRFSAIHLQPQLFQRQFLLLKSSPLFRPSMHPPSLGSSSSASISSDSDLPGEWNTSRWAASCGSSGAGMGRLSVQQDQRLAVSQAALDS